MTVPGSGTPVLGTKAQEVRKFGLRIWALHTLDDEKLWVSPFSSINWGDRTGRGLNPFPALTLPSEQQSTASLPPGSGSGSVHTTALPPSPPWFKGPVCQLHDCECTQRLFPRGWKTQRWPCYEWILSKNHRVEASERSHYGDQSQEKERGLQETSKFWPFIPEVCQPPRTGLPPHQELCWVKRLKVKRTKRGRHLNWLVCSLLPQRPQTWVERAEDGRNSDLDMGANTYGKGSPLRVQGQAEGGSCATSNERWATETVKVEELLMNHSQSLKNSLRSCFLFSPSKHMRAKYDVLWPKGEWKGQAGGGSGFSDRNSCAFSPSHPMSLSHVWGSAHPTQTAHVCDLPVTRLPRFHFIHLFICWRKILNIFCKKYMFYVEKRET